MIPFITSRTSTERLLPPGFAGAINEATCAHSSSVRSLGYANRDRKSRRVRYYFRRRGSKAIPLPGLPGSEEFMAAYAAALAGLPEHLEIGASRTLPGTINSLAVNY